MMRLMTFWAVLVGALFLAGSASAAPLGVCNAASDDPGAKCALGGSTCTNGACNVSPLYISNRVNLITESTLIDATAYSGPYVRPAGARGMFCRAFISASTTPNIRWRIQEFSDYTATGYHMLYHFTTSPGDTPATVPGDYTVALNNGATAWNPSGDDGSQTVLIPVPLIWRWEWLWIAGDITVESFYCDYVF